MRAAEALVKILAMEGIRDAFGIPGAGINPVYQYLADAPIAHCCMRHEAAAVHAADAYFRASHRIALAICTAGPGATNFVTGLYTASIDSIPVLAITGQANSWQLAQEAFQCVDIAAIARPVVKKAFCVTDARQLPAVLREAFHLMRQGRPGPVLIDLPLDVQLAEIDFDPADYAPAEISKTPPDPAQIAQAAEMLQSAAAPVMIMGGGVILAEAQEAMRRLAHRLSIPVITTYMAKGGIAEDDPVNAGHAGIQVGQPIGNHVLLHSDLVLGIGCRFSDRHTGDLTVYRGERRFIHIDIEPSQIGRVFEPDLGIVSDAALALSALDAATRSLRVPDAWRARIAELPALRETLRRKTDYDAIPIKPHRVFAELNHVFGSDSLFTAGCGITQIWSGQLQATSVPMRYLPSGGAGTLGFEIPAALGAKVAQPSLHSVAVVGDFGFTFMGEELAVASALHIPVKAVLINNASLGLIMQNQRGAYGYAYEVAMPWNQDGTVDLVAVCKGYGCQAERVTRPQDIRAALERARDSEGSYVVEVICDPEQLCDMGASIAAIQSFA